MRMSNVWRWLGFVLTQLLPRTRPAVSEAVAIYLFGSASPYRVTNLPHCISHCTLTSPYCHSSLQSHQSKIKACKADNVFQIIDVEAIEKFRSRKHTASSVKVASCGVPFYPRLQYRLSALMRRFPFPEISRKIKFESKPTAFNQKSTNSYSPYQNNSRLREAKRSGDSHRVEIH